ncbi:MAG: hypothetical protein WAU68_05650 [Vitreimonas sp.]
MRFALMALAAAALATPALAQTQTAPAQAAATASWTRVAGTVTAVSATQLTVQAADGTASTVGFAPGWLLVIGHPIAASDIHVGDFVATANANIDDTSGRSVELRVFPPGVHLAEGSRPMADGNTMTNGTVGEVTNVSGGRQMIVRYQGGQRTITLPSNIVVVGQHLAEHSALAVGWNVRVLANPGENGAPPAAFYVYSGENGVAPPH